jgi:hypothetical protein
MDVRRPGHVVPVATVETARTRGAMRVRPGEATIGDLSE